MVIIMNDVEKIESLRKINGVFTYSQAHQDLFVREMLGFKKNGHYLEIGAAEPKQSNNTYILELEESWAGLSFDISSELVKEFNDQRKNPCICADATTFDFKKTLVDNGFPRQIDYLSLDIDPAGVTYDALENIPHKDFRFSVITYEHDCYTSGSQYMLKSRRFLESLGYVRVVSNVKVCGRDFEDWYVDPNVISKDIYAPFISENIECEDIFNK